MRALTTTGMLIAVTMLTGCGRPANWGQPMQQRGLPNLHRISPGLYRGAQPEQPGIASLQAMGVRTIVNLRVVEKHETQIAEAALQQERIAMLPFLPSEEAIVKFIKVAADPQNQPVFVHCQRGSDRTGMMCAAYRVVVDGWSKEAALEEMMLGDYGFNPIWMVLPAYIEMLDVDRIREAAGLPPKPSHTSQVT